MKQFTKYICSFLMLVGMSVNAWGTTITLKVWNHSTGAYYDYGTFEKGSKPGEEPMLYDGYSYYSVIAWAPGEQTDIVHPNNSGADYYGQYAWPNANYNGEATTLYAVYYCQADGAGDYDYYWTTKPSVQVMSCESQGVIVYDESDEDSQIGYYGTLTSFDLTYMSDGSGAVTWSSTNTDVATVVGDGGDGATVTVVGAGSANIVATVAEDATYCEGEGVYELLIEPIAPTVTNFTASCTNNAITITNENSSTVSNKGGLAITRYGYLYSTSVSTPTFGASGVNDANVGTSDVTLNARWVEKNITGLSAGTTYYVRAYAHNGEVYGYSSVVTITTKCAVTYVGNGGTGTTTDASSPYDKLSDVIVMANNFGAPDGTIFDHWAGSDSKNYNPGDEISDITADITLTAQWRAVSFTDAKFSCADWSITGPSGDIVFITSAANKTVRSQEAFHVSGSGLPQNTELTFAIFPVNTKFEFKKADGTIPQTNEFGVVDADVYVFYTPSGEDTGDGLDEFTSLTVSVTGEPRTATIDTKRVIGRHLPADFVIAAKKDGKWWALPSDIASTTNPKPSEIAVNDINNPSVAYTDASNKYGLAAPTASNISGGNGQYIRLTMSIKDGNDPAGPAPLFGSATGTRTLGKSSNAKATSDLSAGWWWQLKQTNTSITNPQDARYTIYCANNTSSLSLRDNAGNPDWGLFASGVEELRLIPASDIVFAEAYFVEWGQHSGVIEVDAEGIDATSVVAHLGEATSSAVSLSSTTGTSVKGTATKYNYTVNFGNDINFAAAASNGAMLMLEWKKEDVVKAMSNIVVPKIIASSATMSSIMSGDAQWETEVHVLPSVTLTANAGDFSSNDVLINHLEIYPGATVVVTKGDAVSGTLKVNTLVLHNGWTRAGAKAYDVARLYITPSTASMAKNAVSDVWYADWYIDYDQYYPIAVPWEVTVANIRYKNTNSAASVSATGSVRLRYYDGASRAANGQSGVDAGSNWKLYGADGCTAVPATLTPSTGYAMTAKRPTGKAFSIVRMPLTIPSAAWTTAGEQGEVTSTHKDQVAVTAHGVDDPSKPRYTVGWNLVANPYMALHQGALSYTEGDETIEYANIPDEDFREFDQQPIATTKLKPASGFLIQAPKDGTVTFDTGSRVTAAPSYRNAGYEEQKPVQRAYILLANDDAEDMMGLLVSEKYTAEYEMNADLEKLLSDGNTLRTYMRYGDLNMAYVAINEGLAKELIPVIIRVPASGEYTFRLHDASTVDELEGVYLTDYLTGKTTNLLYDEYTFTAEAGTPDNRFALNAVVGKRDVPTGADISGADKNGTEPVKFIWHDKVYILHNSMIYDATGKRVHVINK